MVQPHIAWANSIFLAYSKTGTYSSPVFLYILSVSPWKGLSVSSSFFAVAVEVHHHGVACGVGHERLDGPLAAALGWGREAESAAVAGDKAGLYAVVYVPGISVVLEHVVLEQHQREAVILRLESRSSGSSQA